MFSLLFFGLFLGAMAAALDKAQGGIDIVRFAILATVGAMSGKLLASLISQTYALNSKPAEAVGIILGSLLVIFLRKLLFPHPYPNDVSAIE